MARKIAYMKVKAASLLLLAALGVGSGAYADALSLNHWLTPACTADSPYSFEGAADGDGFLFPSASYKEWSVFNPAVAASEAEQTYTVFADGARLGLAFNNALANDEGAYLSLGIRETDADTALGLDLTPAVDVGKFRLDNLYATVKFFPSDECPSMDTLREMYPTFADRDLIAGELPPHTAAKLGICVMQDGYFYVSRVYSGLGDTAPTGTPDDLTFQFCKTEHTYDEVGSGAVTIRIEFLSYCQSAADPIVRGFRIFAKPADGGDEICLTEKRGYAWIITEESGYAFDFSSFERDAESCWLYAIDNALAVTGEERFLIDGLDTLNQLGFSATAGAFYAAWLETDRTVAGAPALAAYNLGSFEPFVTSTGALFSLYTDWARTYNVDLTEYLERNDQARVSLAAAAEATLTEEAFDAFLLNMDPKQTAGQPLALSVTGLVPDAAEQRLTLTVRGPEGCSLAQVKAAKLCVRRAASLDGMASATACYYPTPTPDSQGNLILVLPLEESAQALPFMQVTLVPVSEDVAEYAAN